MPGPVSVGGCMFYGRVNTKDMILPEDHGPPLHLLSLSRGVHKTLTMPGTEEVAGVASNTTRRYAALGTPAPDFL